MLALDTDLALAMSARPSIFILFRVASLGQSNLISPRELLAALSVSRLIGIEDSYVQRLNHMGSVSREEAEKNIVLLAILKCFSSRMSSVAVHDQ